jgi:hypothetical protein
VISSLIGLLLPAGAVWLWLLAIGLRAPQHSRALTAAVALCGGLGLSSLVTFWWLVAGGAIGPLFVAVDALSWTIVAAFAWRRRSSASRLTSDVPVREPRTPGHWLVCAAFAGLAAIAAAVAVMEHVRSPHGQPDATLIWNLKARFMIRGGGDWTAFVRVPWSNPSHPLLVSASVARLWAYAGAELPTVPLILGAATGIAVVAAVVGVLDPRRTRAWIAASVVVAPLGFSQSIAAQTADLPMALYLLVTIILIASAGAPSAPARWGGSAGAPSAPARWGGSAGAMTAERAAIATGIVSGLAAWVKNEGLVVFIIAFGIVAWRATRTRRPRALAGFAAAAAPALVTIAWLKLVMAPVAPEYFGGSPGLSAQVTAVDAALVGTLAGRYWMNWGTGMMPAITLAAAMVAATRDGRFARQSLAVLGVVFAAYCTVWWLTPLDTAWLMSTTADRLLLQLWPALVVAAFSARLPRLPASGNLMR